MNEKKFEIAGRTTERVGLGSQQLQALDAQRIWFMSAFVAITVIVAGFYFLRGRTRTDRSAFDGFNTRPRLGFGPEKPT